MKNLKRSALGMSFLITLLSLSGCSLSERVEIAVTDKSGIDIVLSCPTLGVGNLLWGHCHVIKQEHKPSTEAM